MRLVLEYILLLSLILLGGHHFKLELEYGALNESYTLLGELLVDRTNTCKPLIAKNSLLNQQATLYRTQIEIQTNALQMNNRKKYYLQVVKLMKKRYIQRELNSIENSLKNYVTLPYGIKF